MGAVRIFHHLYAFEKIPHHGSITYRELAEQVDADARLIERFGNMLVSVGILNLEGADRISHTPRSQIFLDHHPTGLMCNSLMDIMGRASLNYHMYFDKYGLKEPGGAFTTTPASYGFGQPDKNIWAIMSENPRVMEEFSIGMNIMEKFLPVLGMYDFSWVAEYAKNGPDKERKLIVDVGCGKGHSLKAFLGEQPDIPAERCVLQDRIDVIKHVKQLDEPELRKAEKQVIDFFIDEPVKSRSNARTGRNHRQLLKQATGALIYFIRRCMHDWSDDWNVKMLSNVRKACASDSRVLICEQLLASPPIPSQASLDLCVRVTVCIFWHRLIYSPDDGHRRM